MVGFSIKHFLIFLEIFSPRQAGPLATPLRTDIYRKDTKHVNTHIFQVSSHLK